MDDCQRISNTIGNYISKLRNYNENNLPCRESESIKTGYSIEQLEYEFGKGLERAVNCLSKPTVESFTMLNQLFETPHEVWIKTAQQRVQNALNTKEPVSKKDALDLLRAYQQLLPYLGENLEEFVKQMTVAKAFGRLK